MRASELVRLVWLNINQNKFKTVMTSIGIVVGAATIVMVIAIGRGGQMDVAEEFSSLNAGAIDVSYDWEGEEAGGSGGFFSQMAEGIGNFFGGAMSFFGGGQSGSGQSGDSGPSGGGRDGMQQGGSMEMPDGSSFGGRRGTSGEGFDTGSMPEGFDADSMPEDFDADSIPESSDEESVQEDSGAEGENGETEMESETSLTAERLNQEQVILTEADLTDIETFVQGISGATISYTTRGSVEGGSLSEAQTYTIAGVKENYASVSNLTMAAGAFLDEAADDSRERVCVLGRDVAEELYDSADEAVGSTLYIADRAYTIIGVLAASQTVSAGITPDESVFVPYQTGIKYITGESIDPVITVIAEDTGAIEEVEADVQTVLQANYSNVSFSFSDSGSRMEAAESSNQILTVMLSAMAAIVFLVGGIGIMNVLFVSVKERTNEIGVLKAMGASRSVILSEFLLESAAISFIGGVLGVAVSFAITPVVEHYDIRVEANGTAWLAALGFAVLTGTLFGLYPAWKASRLVPVDALNAE